MGNDVLNISIIARVEDSLMKEKDIKSLKVVVEEATNYMKVVEVK
jgi:hypothetical protein